MLSRATYRILLALFLAASSSAFAAPFVWPLSGTTEPDKMHTSFGPRINFHKWDFHDGVDLPGRKGTPVKAIADGEIFLFGPGGINLDFSSNHVVLKTQDSNGDTLYAAYVHLDKITEGLKVGQKVKQGFVLGALGDQAASYPHLHFEIRRHSPLEPFSEHPLKTLPYSDSANFGPAEKLSHAYVDGDLVVRAVFSAPDRQEGDLSKVEVDLRRGRKVLETRVVHLSDKNTINEGLGDEFQWKNDISLEGYQYSNMRYAGYKDIQYGVLLRRLPPKTDRLAIRVIDLAGHVTESLVKLKDLEESRHYACDFEKEPGPNWTHEARRGEGSGKLVTQRVEKPGEAASGNWLGEFEDSSRDEKHPQMAALVQNTAIENRHQLAMQGNYYFADLGLVAPGKSLFPLAAWNSKELAAAFTIRLLKGHPRAGVMTARPDGTYTSSIGAAVIPLKKWVQLRLELSRLHTRQSIAVVFVDGVEAARFHWDSNAQPVEDFRFGAAYTSVTVQGRLWGDDFEVSDDLGRQSGNGGDSKEAYVLGPHEQDKDSICAQFASKPDHVLMKVFSLDAKRIITKEGKGSAPPCWNTQKATDKEYWIHATARKVITTVRTWRKVTLKP